MKKFLLSAIAVSMIATPALAAPDHGRNNQHGVVAKHNVHAAPPRVSYRSSWRKGERFDSHQARNYRQISNYRSYRLAAPPRGYRYVQSGNDAVLVGITTGLIAGVIAGAIH